MREIFKDGSDLCYVPLVWPHIVYIAGAGGDGLTVYYRLIKEKYTGGCLKNMTAGVMIQQWKGLSADKLANATHICWATGGRLVPDEVWDKYMNTYL